MISNDQMIRFLLTVACGAVGLVLFSLVAYAVGILLEEVWVTLRGIGRAIWARIVAATGW